MLSDQPPHQFRIHHRRRLAKDQYPLVDQLALFIRHSVVRRRFEA
jgi:hypothetical protein